MKRARKTKDKLSQQLTVRAAADMVARIDRIAKRLGARIGIPIARSDALRAIVLRGLDQMESEKP